MKKNVKRPASDIHKVTKRAIRSVAGAYACRRPEAKLPFRVDDRALSFLAELRPVRIDPTVKITPGWRW